MGRRSAKIASRKQATELARVKLFSLYGKKIVQASKSGGNVDAVIKEALDRGVPKENIRRALEKAASNNQSNYEAKSLEFYGPSGVGIFVDILTDNVNRAVADARNAAKKAGFTVATPGSVAFNFERKGCVVVEMDKVDGEMTVDLAEDTLIGVAASGGAEDVERYQDSNDSELQFRVWAQVTDLAKVQEHLEREGVKILDYDLRMVPKTWVETVTDEGRETIEHGIEALSALDDVDAVYSTMLP